MAVCHIVWFMASVTRGSYPSSTSLQARSTLLGPSTVMERGPAPTSMVLMVKEEGVPVNPPSMPDPWTETSVGFPPFSPWPPLASMCWFRLDTTTSF